jgi:hypothetical protein
MLDIYAQRAYNKDSKRGTQNIKEEMKMELSKRIQGVKSWALEVNYWTAECIGDASMLCTVSTPDFGELTGWMFGNDECFSGDDFYQYLICPDGKLYQLYFECPADCEDLGDLDYDHSTGGDELEFSDDYDGSHKFDPMFDLK